MNSDIFEQGLREFGIDPRNELVDLIKSYHEILIEWNGHTNLTSVTDWNDAVYRHYLDSASLVMIDSLSSHFDSGHTRLIDVGTGAGLPGMILKLLFPKLHVTLLESSSKKCHFLQEVCKKLDLSGLEIVSERAEIQGHKQGYRESYDIVVSRAVSKLNVLAEYCLPFCNMGGVMVAMKGRTVNAELHSAINSISVLGGRVIEVVDCSTRIAKLDGRLVVVLKDSNTPDRYPRRAGMPAKRPIR